MNRFIKPKKLLVVALLLLAMPMQLLAFQSSHSIGPNPYAASYVCGASATYETSSPSWGTSDLKSEEWILVYPDASEVTTCAPAGNTLDETLSCTFTIPDGPGTYTLEHHVNVYSSPGVLDYTSYAETSVTVVASPLSTPGAISGLYRNCYGSDEVYSVTAVSSANGYDWQVPTGWSIEVGGTNEGYYVINSTNSIIIHPPSTGSGTGLIKVRARDNSDVCESVSAWSSRTIAYGPKQNFIEGISVILENTGDEPYSISTAGVTSGTIDWDLPITWSFETGYDENDDYILVNVGTAGTVTLSVSYESCGQTMSDDLQVTVTTQGGQQRTGESIGLEGDGTIAVYPNPGNNTMTVQAPGPIKSLVLYDVQGRPVHSFSPSDNAHKMDLRGIPAGIYMLHTEHEGGKDVQRIVIE